MMQDLNSTFDYKILINHAFGLIDPTIVDELPENVTGKPLVPADLRSSAHLMPVLLDLRALTEESNNALLTALYDAHMHQQAPVARVLIETDADSEQFSRHWNNFQLVSPRPGIQSWLRLHDPRVLHQIWRVLTPSQRQTLLGKAHAISYWIAGQWVHIRAPSSDKASPESAALVSGQGNIGWDWGRIEQIGIINRALERLHGENPDTLLQQGDVAESLIARACALHGLTAQEDLVEFVYRGLSSTPLFDQHPTLATVIRASDDPADDTTLADRFALIEETVWADVRGQMGTSNI